MTKIKINQTNSEFKIEIEGHAGYGRKNCLPPGCDIVCASVSTLAYTIMKRVQDMEKEKKVRIVTFICEPGKVVVHISAKKIYVSEMVWTMTTIQTAFQLLENTYPDYITVLKEGEL